ncbi:MAG: response regulator [Rhodospirillales bacterium]|nr:response regulator [Rhodospirillales bacterium]
MVKFLVVDDEETVLGVIKQRLIAVGHEVDTAIDGDVALVRALETQPDVLLLDMNMPNISGYETAKELRAKGFSNPIIAVTANSQVNDIQQSFASGCNYLIPKPIDENFEDRIAAILEKAGVI